MPWGVYRLIYKDYVVGTGRRPTDGEQVKFEYTGYNENGARIDSTYGRGYPAETQLGVGGLIPGIYLSITELQSEIQCPTEGPACVATSQWTRK